MIAELKVFLISVSTLINAINGHIHLKGAPFNGAPQTFLGGSGPHVKDVLWG